MQITKVSGGCKLPDPQCESLNLPCDLTTPGGEGSRVQKMHDRQVYGNESPTDPVWSKPINPTV